MGKLTRAKPKLTARPGGKLERPKRPPRGTAWPDFRSFFRVEDDPLAEIDLGEDQEQNAEKIMGAVREVFIVDEARKLDDYRTQIDPGFYCVVCFQSRAQKDDFLSKAGWSDLGPLYIDGLAVARRMGLDVPPFPLEVKPIKKTPRVLRDVQTVTRGGE